MMWPEDLSLATEQGSKDHFQGITLNWEYLPMTDQGSQIIGFGQLNLADVMTAPPSLAQAMHPYDPVYTASLAAGLLTEPSLQSNCVRLEALSHLALCAGNGQKKPTPRAVATWYEELGTGPYALSEDPAEAAFTTVITTEQGNFRILEGMWKSAAFYLQRIVNIVETTPGDESWLALRESVRAMLKLSELVCDRSGFARYTFGNAICESKMTWDIERSILSFRNRVVFSVAELKDHGISLEALEPFVFRPKLRDEIAESSLTHSPLVHHPLLLRSGQLVVALPTSLSVAIRGLVVGGLTAQGLKSQFLSSLAGEYEEYFRDHPPLA